LIFIILISGSFGQILPTKISSVATTKNVCAMDLDRAIVVVLGPGTRADDAIPLVAAWIAGYPHHQPHAALMTSHVIQTVLASVS
jgi:hypothetical protein